ncbi:hypothetical protein CMZ84_10590 [Lysobacteraceae bacterium NML93-0399]|nr:hypothetical protein CMZ84_10590 [Xanthomonadaceae bacterium NML93-0399]
MLPGMELMGCTDLVVPAEVMHHVVGVESSFNPFAIGVVGGRLARQPRTLEEALSTSRMLEREGYNFSLGLAQVNRHNLTPQGLDSHERAFDVCANLRAGARILADCHRRAGGDWGKAFSCYYSGNFETGFRHGYVQKVMASWQAGAPAIPVAPRISAESSGQSSGKASLSRLTRRIDEAVAAPRAVAPAGPRSVSLEGPDGAVVASHVNRAIQTPEGSEGPVLVQPTGAAAANAAPQKRNVSSTSHDEAFVF